MEQNLRIPGPTPLPQSVREAMSKPMINHRGPEFKSMFDEISGRLQRLHQTTENDILIFPGSGTGAMEAAVVNLFSSGDKVLSVTAGVFGDRFAKIAKAFGLNLDVLSFPWGQAVDPQAVASKLSGMPDAKAVLVTYNETSTAVTHDLGAISKVVKQAGKLLVVDAVSAVGAINLETDNWGCDIVVSGAQKAWMSPPGLAIVCVSKAAWEANKTATLPRYYWDFQPAKTSALKGQTPYTPAITNLYALQEALRLIEAEGMQNVFERHVKMARITREAVKGLGLELFADPAHASNVVTAIRMPKGIDPDEVRKVLRDDYKIIIAGGQQDLKSEIVRIAHLGYFKDADIMAAVNALGEVINLLKKR